MDYGSRYLVGTNRTNAVNAGGGVTAAQLWSRPYSGVHQPSEGTARRGAGPAPWRRHQTHRTQRLRRHHRRIPHPRPTQGNASLRLGS